MPEIKNLKKAARRIKKAIEDSENIILYSDADLDGTTSLLILEEAIKNLGGKVAALYFPDREKEGYGLNEAALILLKEYAPALMIILDSGIGNFKEIQIANNLGFEIIVIEHHEILNGKPPEGALIIDPKQAADKYPFKKLATVGIVYKLNCLLLEDKLSFSLQQSFLELAALGTLADMMPETEDNEMLIEEGLKTFLVSFRPGLICVIKIAAERDDSPKSAAHKLASILNITEVKNHLTMSYLILKSANEREAQTLAQDLFFKYQQGRREVKEITQEIEMGLFEEGGKFPIIFEGSPDWSQALTGTVASRVCNKHKKPAFIFKLGSEVSRGSVRVPEEINSVKALASCSHLLEMYGGHPPASGFTVKNENLEKLRECLLEYFKGIV